MELALESFGLTAVSVAVAIALVVVVAVVAVVVVVGVVGVLGVILVPNPEDFLDDLETVPNPEKEEALLSPIDPDGFV